MSTEEMKNIAYKLTLEYPHYYETVHFDLIVDAVEASLKDIGTEEDIDISLIHKNIKENYI